MMNPAMMGAKQTMNPMMGAQQQPNPAALAGQALGMGGAGAAAGGSPMDQMQSFSASLMGADVGTLLKMVDSMVASTTMGVNQMKASGELAGSMKQQGQGGQGGDISKLLGGAGGGAPGAAGGLGAGLIG